MAANDGLLNGEYSMLMQGFVRAPAALTGNKSPDPRGDVVLGPVEREWRTDGDHKYMLADVPETHFAVSEAPVMAGYLPSEQFPFVDPKVAVYPPPNPPIHPSYLVHGGYLPFAALGVVRFDGEGGIYGSAQTMLGGNPSISSGPNFFPDMEEAAIQPGFSGYEVDDGGTTGRARIAYDLEPNIDANGQLAWKAYKDLHVLICYFTILAHADELHCLVIASNARPVVQSGVMKRLRHREI